MAGLNKCEFIGNLGADPKKSITQSGKVRTTARIAAGEQWKDRDGKQQERVEWIPLVFWGKQAEAIATYSKKGSQLYVEGKFRTRNYEVEEGGQKVIKYMTEVHVNSFQFLGSKPKSDESTGQETGPGTVPLDDTEVGF
jgi:single-strand DNA-binding protein